MGMDTHEERIGRLVKRYSETRALIAGLRDSLNCASKDLIRLSHDLTVQPHALHVSETGQVGPVSPSLVTEIGEKVEVLKEALADKQAMENCLREAGLGDLVR